MSGTSEEPTKKTRPRLDRKVFGLVLGTLQKASHEDKVHRASDAAKKRQQLETRLASKLRSETAVVRRKEDARRDKTTALRKEEEWGVRDSVAKQRRKRLPLLAAFLCTAGDDLQVKRGHPPPVYYLPKLLLPEQEDLLARRQQEAKDAAEREWAAFMAEKEAGIREIEELRRKVSQAEKAEREDDKERMDVDMDAAKKDDEAPAEEKKADEEPVSVVEDNDPDPPAAPEKKDEPMQAADEDEVEY
ncbi:hypothetical protein BDZ89DRAFT_231821 [Hymenopellis radicata]|nr:hypothetical protein BDZ89DRAFT_231821 [Hymenopellis radicata]